MRLPLSPQIYGRHVRRLSDLLRFPCTGEEAGAGLARGVIQ